MIKQTLLGILALLIVTLCAVVLYLGLLTILIQPGQARQAGAFTIERGVYLDTAVGRVAPVVAIEGGGVVTYTFVVRKGD